MKMRTLGIGLLIACFAVGLAGCGAGGTDQGPVPDKIPPKTESSGPPLKPGMPAAQAAPPMDNATKNPSGAVPTKK